MLVLGIILVLLAVAAHNVGAFLIGDTLWNSHPGVSIGIGIVVGAVALVNAVPSLVVTLLRNRMPIE